MEHADVIDAIQQEIQLWDPDEPGRKAWEALLEIVERHSPTGTGKECNACGDEYPCEDIETAVALFDTEVREE